MLPDTEKKGNVVSGSKNRHGKITMPARSLAFKEDVSGIFDVQAVDEAGGVVPGIFGIGPGIAD